MHKINIKPLSLNHAYRGRRFATYELKKFKNDTYLSLPPKHLLKLNFGANNPILELNVTYGTSKANDLDNLNKTFIDVLTEKYGFNDNKIYKITSIKHPVQKGEEYISFELKEYHDIITP